MLKRLSSILNLGAELRNLPVVEIDLQCKSKECEDLFRNFTRPHSKLPVIKAKSWGVGILDLREMVNASAYISSVSGKNSAAYFSRKAERSGYEFKSFNANDELEGIFQINTSASERQGNEMAHWYATKQEKIELSEHFFCRGVYHDGVIKAYAFIGVFGELAIISNILGHADHLKDGIMYKLVTGLCSELTELETVKFVMYDTMLGASPGLRMFKERCGFKAHRVKWKK